MTTDTTINQALAIARVERLEELCLDLVIYLGIARDEKHPDWIWTDETDWVSLVEVDREQHSNTKQNIALYKVLARLLDVTDELESRYKKPADAER